MAEDRQSDKPKSRTRSYRVLILGLALTALNIILLLYMEVGAGSGPYPSTISLFANAILFLFVLTVLNNLCARRFPMLALDRAELLIIYVMLTISTAIVSIDFLDVLVPMITYPFRFATPENRWAEIILPHISPLISMRDPEALRAWYEGSSTLYTWAHIRPWIVPVSVWSGVILAMLFVMFCINTIVRRQWMQNEKLVFPIVELPMQITEPDQRLLKSRLMWLGFSISGGISILNGLHQLFPSVPYIQVKMWDIQPLLVNWPWSAIGWTPISFYPYGIGFGFLLPVDMLFSCWFFYVMWRVIRVLGGIYGVYNTTPNFPFMNQQAFGAYCLIAIFALWSGRRHLARVFRTAFTTEKDPHEAEGPLSYRIAVFGMILGTAALIGFFHIIGLRWWVAAAGMAIYFFLALAIARMHAEFGPPAHDLHYMGPEMVLIGAFGTRSFGAPELTGLSWFWWFNRAYRSIPIAYQLDGLKLAQRGSVSQKRMALAICLASVAAVFVGFWVYIHLGYSRGASARMAGHVSWFGWEAFGYRLQNWLTAPTKPDKVGTLAIAWGMIFTYFLYFMKSRFVSWPFHPLGFAISTSYSIGTLWFPLFIAWCAKILTLRFGGLRMYKILLNFFLGLLLGDFLIGCLWPIVGWIFGVSTYSFMQ